MVELVDVVVAVIEVSEGVVSVVMAVVALWLLGFVRLVVGYIIQLLLLVSSLIRVRAGGVLRSSFRPLHITDGGLLTVATLGPSDRSSDSMEPANLNRDHYFDYVLLELLGFITTWLKLFPNTAKQI